MKAKFEGRFDECMDCLFFSRNRESPFCKQCDAGEFYEPRVLDKTPSEHDLMIIFQEMYEE